MAVKKKPLIIGLVGEIGSGKDTIAAYLAKAYGAKTISFSQPLRDILDRIFLPQTRENMANLGITLRNQFGQDLLSRVICEEIKSGGAELSVLPNVRLESDIIYLRELPGFVMVRVDCDAKTRFERIKTRGQNADDATKTWEQFLKDAELPTEVHIRELAERCDHAIDNNGNLESLYRQIDDLLAKIN